MVLYIEMHAPEVAWVLNLEAVHHLGQRQPKARLVGPALAEAGVPEEGPHEGVERAGHLRSLELEGHETERLLCARSVALIDCRFGST